MAVKKFTVIFMLKNKVILVGGAILLIGLGVAYALGLFNAVSDDSGNPKSNTNTDDVVLMPSWPAIFTQEQPHDQGTSEKVNADWNVYTNDILGFKIEFPSREFAYGKLESIIRQKMPKVYEIPNLRLGFSYGDSALIIVNMKPTEYESIREWFMQGSDVYGSEAYYESEYSTLDGYKAVRLMAHNPEFHDDQLDENIFLIKDGILFHIRIQYLPQEEREYIFNSFGFL